MPRAGALWVEGTFCSMSNRKWSLVLRAQKAERLNSNSLTADQQRIVERKFWQLVDLVRNPPKPKRKPKPARRPWQSVTIGGLTFASYREYLGSEIWSRIRRRVLIRDRGLCRLCHSKASQVHHKSYAIEVLLGDDIKPLISICRKCHDHIEIAPDGTKRTLAEANKIAKRIAAAHSREHKQ